jgi:outer membrane protein assembly factor BamE (lipoprotein component of BamABCDE complex)
MKITTLSLLFLAVIFSGCASAPIIGKPLPPGDIQQIRAGYTTRDDLVTIFGMPLRSVPGETGEIWVYRYLDGEGANQELIVSFTGDRVSVFSYR